MTDQSETPQDRDEWVAQELLKLLPQITEDRWSEVWAVIGPDEALSGLGYVPGTELGE